MRGKKNNLSTNRKAYGMRQLPNNIKVTEDKFPFPDGIEKLEDIKHIVVDDLRSHQDELDGHDGWVFLRTGADALKFFKDYPDVEADCVYWDHDLGGEDTTRELASYFEERAYFDNPVRVKKMYIHTSNNNGREWISKALRQYPNVIKIHSDDIGLIYDGEEQEDLPGGGV